MSQKVATTLSSSVALPVTLSAHEPRQKAVQEPSIDRFHFTLRERKRHRHQRLRRWRHALSPMPAQNAGVVPMILRHLRTLCPRLLSFRSAYQHAIPRPRPCRRHGHAAIRPPAPRRSAKELEISKHYATAATARGRVIAVAPLYMRLNISRFAAAVMMSSSVRQAACLRL